MAPRSRDVVVGVYATASGIGSKATIALGSISRGTAPSAKWRSVAAILQRQAIDKILNHLGLDPQPPPRAPAGGQMAF
jgi:hypothetical protein